MIHAASAIEDGFPDDGAVGEHDLASSATVHDETSLGHCKLAKKNMQKPFFF